MSKVKSFQLILFAMIVLSVLFPLLGQSSTKNSGDKRPDRLIIQLGAGLSKNEMPSVGFLHDLHTKAVDGKCASCHVEKDNLHRVGIRFGLPLQFGRGQRIQGSIEAAFNTCKSTLNQFFRRHV